jgi:hypothetical protein
MRSESLYELGFSVFKRQTLQSPGVRGHGLRTGAEA